MDKTTMIAAVAAKCNELFNEIDAMNKNLNLSANTVKTQTQLKKHEVHNLLIIKTLLEGKDLEGDMVKWFESTTTLKSVRKNGGITLKEGDDVIQYMQDNPKIQYSKIKKYLAENGLDMVGSTIIKK